MKILVCGSRHWANRETIKAFLDLLPSDTVIINGGARGADTLAKEEALKLGLKVITEYAEWSKYGDEAGPIRNQRMLDKDPDLVAAFHNDIENSRGTRDMIRRARKAGKPVLLIREPP